MAKKMLNVVSVRHTNVLSEAKEPTGFVSGDTVVAKADGKNMILKLAATNAGNVTIKGGTSRIATGEDMVVTLPAGGKEQYVRLDTAFFKQTDGEHTGSILISPAVAGTGIVIEQ